MRRIRPAGQRPGIDQGKNCGLWHGLGEVVATLGLVAGCSGVSVTPPEPDAGAGGSGGGASFPDASEDVPGSAVKRFCDLPGSLQYVNGGTIEVPGEPGTSAVAFLKLPDGFCAHFFAHVGNTRQLRFAPGGELFVASPTTVTTSNGGGGLAAIVVLPDDNGDGTADSTLTYLSGLPSTQGLLFANDHFYYQDHTKILRTPYARGDREPRAPSEVVVDINIYSSGLHWPKTLDQADDGTIYVGNGGDQDEKCDTSRPFRGGILKIDASSPNGTPVSKGFRNPINLRCEHGHNRCFATELSMDYTKDMGGREKLVPIRPGDDWGHPCCFARNVPAFGLSPAPDCSQMTPEDVSFVIGETPFGVDFEPGLWPAPHTRSAFVVLHGAYGRWEGARVVSVEMDGNGLPMPGTSIPGTAMGAMSDFATGWDDGTLAHGRPAAVTFAPDGRLFVGNDTDGTIFWIAPLELAR